jgi:hypothetical protein
VLAVALCGLACLLCAEQALAAAAWKPGVRAAIAYAHTRAGDVSFAVRTQHREWGWRVTRTVPSASS